MKEKIKSYTFFILSALAVGGLSAFFTRNNMDINNDVLMPPLSPPPILFPIVWSILFILMGISAARIKQSNDPDRSKALKTVYQSRKAFVKEKSVSRWHPSREAVAAFILFVDVFNRN